MRRALALLAAAAALAGCGVGAGETSGEVSLTVTRDFGQEAIGQPVTGDAAEGDTVMRLLQKDFEVETRFGGGFVQSIDGLTGGRKGGRSVDWFYYVNGIESSVGAASRRVADGDRVWWDHHIWEQAMRIPAVVGSYPEPFLTGTGGKRFPVKLICLGGAERSCDEVSTRLTDAGVEAVSRSALQQSTGEAVLRVLVGRWSAVRADPVARRLEEGPGASGVFARPAPTGAGFELLDAAGRVVRHLGAGGGLVAATSAEEQAPTWIVSGTDDVGVAAAAAAIQEERLKDHFAIAVESGRGLPLPVSGPGTGP
jgi:hypothetical protein